MGRGCSETRQSMSFFLTFKNFKMSKFNDLVFYKCMVPIYGAGNSRTLPISGYLQAVAFPIGGYLPNRQSDRWATGPLEYDHGKKKQS